MLRNPWNFSKFSSWQYIFFNQYSFHVLGKFKHSSQPSSRSVIMLCSAIVICGYHERHQIAPCSAVCLRTCSALDETDVPSNQDHHHQTLRSSSATNRFWLSTTNMLWFLLLDNRFIMKRLLEKPNLLKHRASPVRN